VHDYVTCVDVYVRKIHDSSCLTRSWKIVQGLKQELRDVERLEICTDAQRHRRTCVTAVAVLRSAPVLNEHG
jgi:hypothetical protein